MSKKQRDIVLESTSSTPQQSPILHFNAAWATGSCMRGDLSKAPKAGSLRISESFPAQLTPQNLFLSLVTPQELSEPCQLVKLNGTNMRACSLTPNRIFHLHSQLFQVDIRFPFFLWVLPPLHLNCTVQSKSSPSDDQAHFLQSIHTATLPLFRREKAIVPNYQQLYPA